MTDNKGNPFYVVESRDTGKNIKVSINALPEEAWTKLGSAEGPDGTDLWRKVPWLWRGVRIKATALSDLPFTFERNGNIVTDSQGYEDPTDGLLPNPRRTFALISSALTVYNRAYFAMPKNRAGFTPELRWLSPTSVTPEFSKADGKLLGFKRKLKNGNVIEFKPDEILYIWPEDPDVEIGPPMSSDVYAAMLAAKAYHAADKFKETFFDRGALKATILTLEGRPVKEEVARIKTWWGRFFRGIQSAWSSAVFNAESVNPVVIGEGLESLQNGELSDALREDIGTALGVPHSLLFSNASNFAVAEQDFRSFYTLNVGPQAKVIADAMNEQLFERINLTLDFDHTQMDIFQEDEEDRSGALVNLISAWASADPEIVTLAMQTMGFELPAGIEYTEFEAMLARVKEKRDQQAAEIAAQREPTPPQELTPAAGTQPPADDKTLPPDVIDYDKWERKSINALDRGKAAAVPFDSEHIDDLTHAAISGALESAETADDVRAVFRFYHA